MAETIGIAKLAEKVSGELFSRFLWHRTGSMNQNWRCENRLHLPRQTHPSDVVFWYDEPYALRRTFINCDLKSYARKSINPGVIQGALANLGDTLSCMEVSEEWQKMYVHEGVSPYLCGLLFMYNHDGEYDGSFDQLLSSIRYEDIHVPKGSQIIILGPQQIRWLDNVRYEIAHMRGNEDLPPEANCRFEYPELVRKMHVQIKEARAATIEMLTGPWITLAHDAHSQNPPGVVVFYRGRGSTAEEFLYLIDWLRHYQMVKSGLRIRVRTLEPDHNAAANFDRAITECIERFHAGNEIEELLKRIEYRQIETVHRSFSQIEVNNG